MQSFQSFGYSSLDLSTWFKIGDPPSKHSILIKTRCSQIFLVPRSPDLTSCGLFFFFLGSTPSSQSVPDPMLATEDTEKNILLLRDTQFSKMWGKIMQGRVNVAPKSEMKLGNGSTRPQIQVSKSLVHCSWGSRKGTSSIYLMPLKTLQISTSFPAIWWTTHCWKNKKLQSTNDSLECSHTHQKVSGVFIHFFNTSLMCTNIGQSVPIKHREDEFGNIHLYIHRDFFFSLSRRSPIMKFHIVPVDCRKNKNK